VPDQPANTGQAMFVMRPDLFRDLDEFKADVDRHLGDMRGAGRPGDVHIAGDGAAKLEEEQRRDGIPIPEMLLGQLRDLAGRFDLDDRLSV
jgi:LDH2 family malate/lactate/ureidoglycolate dehydrogenase